MSDWTHEQRQMPTRLYTLMQEAEYHIACADAPPADREAALTELIEWLHDLRVFVRTGVPMADSDRMAMMAPPA